MPSGVGQAKPLVGSISKSIKLPNIESFNATPENLLSGGSATLVWIVNNVDTVMITPDIGKVNASGSKTVKPSDETTYTLVAINPSGTVAKSVTIKILTALKLGFPEVEKAGSGTQKFTVGTLETDLKPVNPPDSVIPRPDLKVTEVKISNSDGLNADDMLSAFLKLNPIEPNKTVVLFNVINTGTIHSTPFTASLKIDGATKQYKNFAYSLQPAQSQWCAFDYSMSNDPNAYHLVEIMVDVNNTNNETDENNNIFKYGSPYY